MSRFSKFITLLALGSLALAGCNLPGTGSTQEQTNQLGTAVFETAQAAVGATLAAMVTPTNPPTETPAFTPTATLSPDTPTPTLEPSPAFTPTPEVPMVSVTTETNCRSGPGKVYDYLGSITENETAEVFGRDSSGGYWYIRNPDRPGGKCWIWGEYARLTGNTDDLPVIPAPHTPTPSATPTLAPDFKVTYDGMETCSGWFAEFEVTTTGEVEFDSYYISVKDKDADVTVKASSNDFQVMDGCSVTSDESELKKGEKSGVNSGIFDYDPDGNDMVATITLCSKDDLNGVCLTRVVEFKP